MLAAEKLHPCVPCLSSLRSLTAACILSYLCPFPSSLAVFLLLLVQCSQKPVGLPCMSWAVTPLGERAPHGFSPGEPHLLLASAEMVGGPTSPMPVISLSHCCLVTSLAFCGEHTSLQ